MSVTMIGTSATLPSRKTRPSSNSRNLCDIATPQACLSITRLTRWHLRSGFEPAAARSSYVLVFRFCARQRKNEKQKEKERSAEGKRRDHLNWVQAWKFQPSLLVETAHQIHRLHSAAGGA